MTFGRQQHSVTFLEYDFFPSFIDTILHLLRHQLLFLCHKFLESLQILLQSFSKVGVCLHFLFWWRQQKRHGVTRVYTINSTKGCGVCRLAQRIIKCKLEQWQQLLPFFRVSLRKHAHQTDKGLNRPFRLPICLWVMG